MFPLIQQTINIFVRKKRKVYEKGCHQVAYCYQASGSNATMLSTELSSALRGYPLEYETYPLSFNEYCRFKEINVIPAWKWLLQEEAVSF